MNLHKIKRYAPTMFAVCGIVGVVASSVLSGRAAIKAHEIMKNETDTKTRNKQVTKTMVVPVVANAATIFCIIASDRTSAKQKAALITAYGLLNAKYSDYKSRVRVICDEETMSKIEPEPEELDNSEKGKIIFVESQLGIEFESTIEAVQAAEYELNRTYALRGYVSLNDFYSYLGIPNTDIAELFGWSYDVGTDMGYEWIDFSHAKYLDNDGKVYYQISYPFEPVLDYDNWDYLDWYTGVKDPSVPSANYISK